MNNNLMELQNEISFCPYCGSDALEPHDDGSLSCIECGHDFTIMTHE